MILTIASKGPDITAQVALCPSEIQYWIKYDTFNHKFDVINKIDDKDKNRKLDPLLIANRSNAISSEFVPTLSDNLDKQLLTEMSVGEVISWVLLERKNKN
ncbi:MAG: hypothetical protein ABIJ12_08725 [bacterium]